MKCFFSAIVCPLVFIFGATMDSKAAVNILFFGNTRSAAVDFTISGSGEFRYTGSSRSLGTLSLDFDAFNSSGIGSRLDDSFLVSGVTILTNTTTFQSASLEVIFIEDEALRGDDFVLHFSDELSFTTGDSYTISGSGSIGSTGQGVEGFGFHNFNLGSGTGPIGRTLLDVDGLNLSIVPEPSHLILALVGFGAVLVRRQR